MAAGRRRSARAGRRAVAALQGGARRGLGPLRSALRRAGREPRRRTSRRRSRSANRPRRSPSRRAGSRRPRRSSGCRPSGRRSARCSRGREKAIWDRFRAACDRFFTRRHEDLAAAQGGVGREPREERGAVRAGRRRSPSRPTGSTPRPNSGGCRPSGRRSAR